MPLNDESLNSLEDQVALLKREVNSLQIESMSSKKPWYRKMATLVAFAALLFSFGTTAVSYYRTSLQDVLASRIELRGLIKEITSIPEKHAEMLKKFNDKPLTVAELSAQINNRNLVLANQAASVIERIENSAFGRGSVLDVEYAAVATALGNSFQFEKAGAYHKEAAKRSNDPASVSGAIRAQAGIALAKGNVDEMRELMQKARQIFNNSQFRSAPTITKDVTNATTELQWCMAELHSGECDIARTHLSEAEPLVLRIPQSALKEQLAGQLRQLTFSLNNCYQSVPQPPIVNPLPDSQ